MPTPLAERIAENIRVELARRDITQADLARHVYGRYDATTRNLISRRVRGSVPFRGDEVISIAAFLGVPPEQLGWAAA